MKRIREYDELPPLFIIKVRRSKSKPLNLVSRDLEEFIVLQIDGRAGEPKITGEQGRE